MAYTTDGSLGVDLDRVDDEPKFKANTVVIGDDGVAYVYTADQPTAGQFSWVAGDDLKTV